MSSDKPSLLHAAETMAVYIALIYVTDPESEPGFMDDCRKEIRIAQGIDPSNPDQYALVYQAGIANVFKVDCLNLRSYGREAKRVMQSSHRTCENFIRGLMQAGCTVGVLACNKAGDITNSKWEDHGSFPFDEQFDFAVGSAPSNDFRREQAINESLGSQTMTSTNLPDLDATNIHAAMIAAKVQIDHHLTDLYVPVNDTTDAILARYRWLGNVTKFSSMVYKTMWYDISFAYLSDLEDK